MQIGSAGLQVAAQERGLEALPRQVRPPLAFDAIGVPCHAPYGQLEAQLGKLRLELQRFAFDLSLMLRLDHLLLFALALLLLLAPAARERGLEGEIAQREVLAHRLASRRIDVALPVRAQPAAPVGPQPTAVVFD